MFSIKNFFSRSISMISEELSLYMYSVNNNLNVYDVIPYDMILEYGQNEAGNIKGYTHLWHGSSIIGEHIKLVKQKLNELFPEYNNLVQQFDEYLSSYQLKDINHIKTYPMGINNLM